MCCAVLLKSRAFTAHFLSFGVCQESLVAKLTWFPAKSGSKKEDLDTEEIQEGESGRTSEAVISAPSPPLSTSWRYNE